MTRDQVIGIMAQAKHRLGIHAPAEKEQRKLLVDFTTQDLQAIGAKEEELKEAIDRSVRGSLGVDIPGLMTSKFFCDLVRRLRDIKKAIEPKHEEEQQKRKMTDEEAKEAIEYWRMHYGTEKWPHYRVGSSWICDRLSLSWEPYIAQARATVKREVIEDGRLHGVMISAIQDTEPAVRVEQEAKRLAVEAYFGNA